MFYSIVLFCNIAGVWGCLRLSRVEGTSLFYLRRSLTVEQALSWMNVLGLVRRLGPISCSF